MSAQQAQDGIIPTAFKNTAGYGENKSNIN